MFSGDEKKFIAFWTFVFASAIGFWVLAVRWVSEYFA
jgi:hypothetical protein